MNINIYGSDIILIKKNDGGYKEIYKEINNYLE